MKHSTYWQHKLSLWLHDPVHKMFDLRRHESFATDLAELLHVTTPVKDFYQNADMMAAGLTRTALPKFSTDTAQNGAINFSDSAVATHPLVNETLLHLDIPAVRADALHIGLRDLLTKDLGLDRSIEDLQAIPREERPLSGFFDRRNSPEEWAKALYFYLFFTFKKRLRQENVGGLGAVWDILPADSRMPDHPLWHHLGLTSAIGSSLAVDPDKKLSLVVFTITPVQQFISRARKLRDHWVGSIILSYLAFTGIRHVADTLGPDHILYPSLHDQTLVESWIGKDFHLQRFLKESDEVLRQHHEDSTAIASFPNKFVFLCATSQVTTVCDNIEKAIQEEWLRIAGLVKEYFLQQHGDSATLAGLFDHQIADYWQFNHAACRLAEPGDRAALQDVLHPDKWQDEHEAITAFSATYGQRSAVLARLYSTSHTLAQSVLAAAKQQPVRVRLPQQGEKCPLCGEHEVLHSFEQIGATRAREYRSAVEKFWHGVSSKENSENSYAQVGENERLCTVCTVKRFLPKVMTQRKHKGELLATVFASTDSFPSTTEMAFHRYLQKLKTLRSFKDHEYTQLINDLHNVEIGPDNDDQSAGIPATFGKGRDNDLQFTNRDKYYALLLMDGDKMGDLINGQTLTATWADVLHPDLRSRFQNPSFQRESKLRPFLDKTRLINPALHAAISDGLNSFARYGVAPVIQRLGGRLIYAGGDDVCAILPMDAALEAADTIRRSYTMGFVRYTADGAQEPDSRNLTGASKLGMHLGKAEKISISAALVLAHHKTPLREVLRDAHRTLDDIAKQRADRNALAIRLKKRSGGDRDLWLKWDEPNRYSTETQEESLLTSFQKVMQGVTDDLMSGSLLYRLAGLESVIAPLATDETALQTNRDKIIRLIAYEVGHSGKIFKSSEDKKLPTLFAQRLAGIMIRDTSNQPGWYNPEAAIIAHFLALPAQ